MARIEELLRDLGRTLTGQPFTLDAHGLCELQFPDGRQILIEPEAGSDKVHVHSTLARLPPRDVATSIYGELLGANLFGQGTGGACFAIDREHDGIVLNRSFETTWLDSAAFGELIERFIDAAEHWSRRLGELSQGQPAEAAEAATGIVLEVKHRLHDFLIRA